ncbi:zinc-binding dehydrogenase [Bradyrhizobium sp. LHD-71]|uniref:zinc-binding dehydrogenase n=1 Tax=Bradyrhizobium sp. LHD-71 TaxID=3072141 RepID=UPI00281084A8|nr:zinc-binding dehydrogenase [Bradyrhizobium sp. LHD-71]MDQ8732301.1 zinc-binding dehydrogenase [Bradyrhizobium sp. LHD-71]
MPDQVKAIVVDARAPGRLSVQQVKLAPAAPTDVTVRVTAISLNRGEVKRAVTTSEPGARPGWDFAGVVEEAAKQGGGPPVGARVVGMLLSGGWAERVRVPVQNVAALPDGVSDAQASTLPVAGLTALHALRQGGLLLGRKVLVDGASGGVGHLAVQLAAASGAMVFGHVRREELSKTIEPWCNGGIAVGPSIESARELGPFHLILDSVGGQTLASTLTMLRNTGTCVTFGVSEAPTSTFESGNFFRLGGVRLYGLIIFDELARVEPAGVGLALLADLVQRKMLTPKIEVEAPWTEIGRIATDLLDRKFAGKAVLHVS